ncbi:MAG: redoxin domain-containing protein [Gemmataceae bacterium]|nr:redoxin domain-containing protein [Gemmataceae bacterium]
MGRYWTVALLAVGMAVVGQAQAGGKKEKPDKEIRIQGKLTKDDPRDRVRNAASKVYPVTLKRGKTYTIDMVSTQFDSYLRLEDARGKELAQDDDSGGNLNSRIIFACQADGEYKVICTAFNAQGMGDYVLTVKTSGQVQQVTSAHVLMLGKPAPDFQADFAVGGKAGKLSDLKDRVVLLQFWTVRDAGTPASFPKLRAWHKAHKEEGLEVVGVTFYQIDIGQKVGFDKTTGKIKAVEESSAGSEQTMLREFAAHHQLDYLLVALAKTEALKAFDAYAVNGFPQFVLIDRRGVVRLIRVGEGEGNIATVEAEIKKVLAEKN